MLQEIPKPIQDMPCEGSCYQSSSNSLRLTLLHRVNQSQGNLIYVSIQYRLGSFGFLSGAEIREDGVANAGLLDQRLALKWVQKYVRFFGGDPAKVTIMGGSAGGGSVLNQVRTLQCRTWSLLISDR